jgi:hypothetical protein
MSQAVDARFYRPRPAVAIADCGGVGHDAHFIRSLLEQLGAAVTLHLVGTPGDLLQVLGQGHAAAPYLIVCCHGDDNGLVFGEYAPEIDTSMLVAGSMPPECIAKHIDLPDCVVINTGCGAGERRMAEAFMSGQLKAYIGTVEPTPESTAEPLFFAHFFYKLFGTGCSEREAWEHAACYDESSRQYVLYDREGCHRIE